MMLQVFSPKGVLAQSSPINRDEHLPYPSQSIPSLLSHCLSTAGESQRSSLAVMAVPAVLGVVARSPSGWLALVAPTGCPIPCPAHAATRGNLREGASLRRESGESLQVG